MEALRRIIAGLTAVCLAVLFVGAGLLACIAPPVTQGFSSLFARDDLSPFDRNQLVKVADATRDFSFGSHDELSLYQAVFQVDSEYQQKITDAGGIVPADFPALAAVRDTGSLEQYKSAFANASELYCYSPNTVSHLDDCYKLFTMGRTALVIFAVFAVAGLVFVGVTGRKRRMGATLMGAGITTLVLFVALGVWCIIDFNGFFTAFHQLFFAQQGNWEFPYDSLLICSLPEAFWMGMGALCLVVAVLLSILSIVLGTRLRR